MSYADGLAAINLEMPARVPHCEKTLLRHWEIIKEITGLAVDDASPREQQKAAAVALMRSLHLDLRQNTLLHHQPFGDLRTRMSHLDESGAHNENSWSIECPFKSPQEVLRFQFERAYGPVDAAAWKEQFEADYRRCVEETPDLVNTTGIDITLVSGLLDIFGWEMLLLAAGNDLEAFGALADRYTEWIFPYFKALAEADLPVVTIEDNIAWNEGLIFAPAWYQRFLFPNYKRLFAPLLEAGKKILFASSGNYTPFIEDLAACGVHGFKLEVSAPLAQVVERYGQTHFIIGNANPRVLLGSYDTIRAEIERCMAIGKPYPGFFFSLGGDVPPGAPLENLLFYLDTYEALNKRS